MKLALKKSEQSVTVLVWVPDSSSTVGAGLTGLLWNTASLACYYCRPGSVPAPVTLATLAAADSAWASGGFIAVDGTNMPGWYRLDLPDAVCLTGVDCVGITLRGAANMGPCNMEIQLTDADLNNASSLGLANLDIVLSTVAAAVGNLDLVGHEVTAHDGTLLGDMLAAIRACVVGKMAIAAGSATYLEVDNTTTCIVQPDIPADYSSRGAPTGA